MNLPEKKKIAGLGGGAGKKDEIYFCLLEYFPSEKRWFLKTSQQLKDSDFPSSEDKILSWIKEYSLEKLVVDFPISMPPCFECQLTCPGVSLCKVSDVVEAREYLNKALSNDEEVYQKSPKEYEHARGEKNSYENPKVLSKSLKRKFKKQFSPYWNRPLDVKVWKSYHDSLLKFFQVSFNSFGNENLAQILRLRYLNHHLSEDFKIFETNFQICLLEFLSANIIKEKHLRELRHLETAVLGRLDILAIIEKKLKIFIYEKDRETLIKNPRAFQAFIMAVAGKNLLEEQEEIIFYNKESSFFTPKF
jgi:hypothetical protein